LYFASEQPSAATVPGVIVVGDMSTCLSLPGLRVGWIIDADAKRREQIIEARDHFSLSSSPLMEAFAALALREHPRLLAKLASGARANFSSLERSVHTARGFALRHFPLPPQIVHGGKTERRLGCQCPLIDLRVNAAHGFPGVEDGR